MFGVSSPVSHLLSILISYVTLFHLLLPCSNFGDWDQPLSCSASHLAVDSINAFGVFHGFSNPLSPSKLNDGEEGVTTEINIQTQCDIRD
jgi:hypothetical protein